MAERKDGGAASDPSTLAREKGFAKMPNVMFPGRPGYEGPAAGIFGLLHHEILCESSHDVMERVRYVRREKPRNEVAVRLHNMIYLGDCPAALKLAPLDADYEARRAPLDADYKARLATLSADYKARRAPLSADYKAKRAPLDAEIVAYIRDHIPDCAWDGHGLVFSQETAGG